MDRTLELAASAWTNGTDEAVERLSEVVTSARKSLDARDLAALAHVLAPSRREYFAVVYGNYFPRETDSTWATRAEAEKRRDELNDGMWEIEKRRHGVVDE